MLLYPFEQSRKAIFFTQLMAHKMQNFNIKISAFRSELNILRYFVERLMAKKR